MRTTRTSFRRLESTAPISWPTLSELASWLYGQARGLDTLGREVRRLRVTTRKIGRELRIEPRGAVRVLEARGVTAQQATDLVTRAVETRIREVPALNVTSARPVSTTKRDEPYGSMRPALVAAMKKYEAQMFGISPADLLTDGIPTDITSTEDLLGPVTGARS
jgi:hypothetical protein